MQLDKFQKLQKKRKELQQGISESEGVVKHIESRLKKEYDCGSIAEAKEVLKEKKREQKKLQQKFDKAAEKFEKEFHQLAK